MKKVFLFAVMITAAMRLDAQQSDFVYRDFDPDLALHVGSYPRDTIWMDFDNDNMPDIYLYSWFSSPSVGVKIVCCNQTVRICQAETNDTIPYLEDWKTFEFYPHLCDTYAIRIEKESGYYYGWFRTYVIYEPHVINDFCFDKFAFCTIPDYPLQWGQTEFWGVAEAGDTVFAEVHPNPTSGLLSIEGTSLEKAEVRNTLGQSVATAKGQGGRLTVDISGLPAGVYFVSVADQNGRKCVRKVVKE